MKLRTVLATTLLSFFSISAFACCTYNCNNWNRLGVQAAMATGGNLGIGVVDFTECTELGATISGRYNNAQTRTITPVIFGGLRKHLGQMTYFAYGLDVASTFGRISGCNIQASYQVGPYISLEQMLTCHIMLAGWIQPYQYSYEKRCGSSLTTNNFFGTGGIAINYLF